MSVTKTYQIVKSNDGWVTVSTPSLDRDKDRVLPLGLELEHYQRNPVLMWGHNYRDPFAVIGRAADMQLSPDAFRLKPEFREPASDDDPMHIIRALWDADLVRAFSIGFVPKEYEENEEGGRDYTRAEILEVSLVPIPANQEALKQMVKAFAEEQEPDPGQKPYPNEHACRLRDPGDFQAGSFRRTSRKHEGKQYHIIMGRLKGETNMTEQAYRYPKDTWEAAAARSHCKAHDGQEFEPASGESRDADTEQAKPEPEPTPEPQQPMEQSPPEELDAPADDIPEELLDALAGFLQQIAEQIRSDNNE